MPRQRRKQLTLTKRRRRKRAKRKKKKSSRRGIKYSQAFRDDCLKLLRGGMTKAAIREEHGVTEMTLGRWEQKYGLPDIEDPNGVESKTNTPTQPEQISRAPHDNIAGLAQKEIDEILKLKKEHFTMGPAQIRAQLKRFHGWRISVKAISRVLKAHGYHVEHKSKRDEQALMRFEAPYPNALWMMDALSFRVHEQRLYLHLVIDDFSRFIVSHRVGEEITTDEAVSTLKEAIHRHGKPERLLTDRGGQFIAVRGTTAFRRYLETELIDHSLSRPYHPQTLGKVESVNRAIQKELIYLHEFRSAEEAKARIASWVDHFNFRRAHLGIDGLVPADRYFGLHQRALAEVQARSRGRLAAAGHAGAIGGPLDDLGGPLEILRFVLVDGHLEVRFCGLRVALGKAIV
ncbi:MAG: DDE-type integrase/transposase/recombinase [Phycisphaerae bacterium]